MSNEQNLPVPMAAPANVPAVSDAQRALAELDAMSSAFRSNISPDNSEWFLRVQQARALSDKKSKEIANTTISVVGYAIDYGAVGESEDGEIREGLRGHLLCVDGTSIFTTSMGVLRAVCDAHKAYGQGPWQPAVLIEIRRVKARRGDALVGVLRGRAEPSKTKAR